jgi:hypothetical protein
MRRRGQRPMRAQRPRVRRQRSAARLRHLRLRRGKDRVASWLSHKGPGWRLKRPGISLGQPRLTVDALDAVRDEIRTATQGALARWTTVGTGARVLSSRRLPRWLSPANYSNSIARWRACSALITWPLGDVQRGVEARGPGTLVAMRRAFRDPRQDRQDRQDRCGPVERLYLAPLVHTEHDCPLAWVEVQDDDLADLLDEPRVLGQLRKRGRRYSDLLDALSSGPRFLRSRLNSRVPGPAGPGSGGTKWERAVSVGSRGRIAAAAAA